MKTINKSDITSRSKYGEHEKPNSSQIKNQAIEFKKKTNSISVMGQDDIWTYNNKYGYFEPNGEEILNDLCYKTPGWNFPDIAKRMISSVRSISRISEEEFKTNPSHINFINGVLPMLDFDDSNNENLLSHSPEYKFKYYLDFKYDPQDDCPNFKHLLESMFDEKDRKLIIRWMAYHFYRGDKESKALFIEGPPATGKGIICETIKNIMGPRNCNYASFKDLSEDLHYSVANLYGKLANIDFDLSYKAIKDTGMFKKLTSGEPVTVRMIRNKPFSFEPNIRFTFACNKLPYLSEDILFDDAFWRRIIILQTTKTYTEKDRYLYLNISNEHAGIFNLIFKELREMLKDEKHMFEDIDYRKIWTYSMWKWKYETKESKLSGDTYDTMMEHCETGMSIEDIKKCKQLTGEEIKKRALINKVNADIRNMTMKQYR